MQFFRWAIPESEMPEIPHRIRQFNFGNGHLSFFLKTFKNFFHVIRLVKPSSAAAWALIPVNLPYSKFPDDQSRELVARFLMSCRLETVVGWGHVRNQNFFPVDLAFVIQL
jgi:hypothetical protein